MVEREEEESVHELNPHSKLKNGRDFGMGIVYGLILGFLCVFILDINLVTFGFIPGPSPTPPLHFNLHSFNLSSSSSSSNLLFSVLNPLPFALHVSLARASLSCTPPHRLLATGFVPSFRVPATTPDQVVMVSADLSSSAAPALDAAGFEFQVDGLVKIREGSRRQRMRSMKVVCKDFEVLFSLDFTAATLLGGPNKCVQSWGDIY